MSGLCVWGNGWEGWRVVLPCASGLERLDSKHDVSSASCRPFVPLPGLFLIALVCSCYAAGVRDETLHLREELGSSRCEADGLKNEVAFLKVAVAKLEGEAPKGKTQASSAMEKQLRTELQQAKKELAAVTQKLAEGHARDAGRLSEEIMSLTAEIGMCRLEAREILDQLVMCDPGSGLDNGGEEVAVDLRWVVNSRLLPSGFMHVDIAVFSPD